MQLYLVNGPWIEPIRILTFTHFPLISMEPLEVLSAAHGFLSDFRFEVHKCMKENSSPLYRCKTIFHFQHFLSTLQNFSRMHRWTGSGQGEEILSMT